MLTLLTLSFLSGPAEAAGYYTSDVGVRAFSRGGAYVAGPSDLLALWYNPAALTRMGDGLVTLDVAGVGQSVSFDRADYPGEGPIVDGEPTDLITPPIENSAPAFVIPHLGAAWSFGLPDTVFAVGFYPPYAADFQYSPDGPQRYSLIDTMVIQTFTGASVAHRFFDRLSVGAGASWNLLQVEQELAVTIPLNPEDPTAIEDPQYDVRFAMEGSDPWALAWNVGLLYEPPSNAYAVGLMMQAPTAFEATGSLNADFSENFFHTDETFGLIASETATDPDIDFEVSMPLIVRAGVLVRPIETLEIELASVYEGWSVIDQVTLKNVNMTVDIDDESAVANALGLEDIVITDDVVLPAGYQDTWSWRLGGEWRAHDKLSVRAGGMLEGTAIPVRTQGVNLMDGKKWGYGLGVTARPIERLGVDLGWFQSFIPERTITNSELQAITLNWQSGELVDGRVIGDGVLSGHATLFGAGVNYAFGKRPGTHTTLGHAPADG